MPVPIKKILSLEDLTVIMPEALQKYSKIQFFQLLCFHVTAFFHKNLPKF